MQPKFCGEFAQAGAQRKNIFYRRHIPVPSGVNMYDLLHTHWRSSGNRLGLDFSLHSSYADAVSGKNGWSFCNYDDPGIGFPRDCGPRGYVPHQWQSSTRGGQSQWAWFLDESTISESILALDTNACNSLTDAGCGSNDSAFGLRFGILHGNELGSFRFVENSAATSAGSRGTVSVYSRKYFGKSPRCGNLAGSNSAEHTFGHFQRACNADASCTGFTFSARATSSTKISHEAWCPTIIVLMGVRLSLGHGKPGSYDYWHKGTVHEASL